MSRRRLDPSIEARGVRWIIASLITAILAGTAILVVYALGGQVQIEGVLLALLLGGIGFGLIFWGKYLFSPKVITEPRGSHESAETEVEAAEEAFAAEGEQIARRSFLVRLLVGAAGALGLAAVFPIRSLGPSPGRTLFQTAWTNGALVVDETGTPVGAANLEIGGVITVFPEGHLDADDAQAIIVRVDQQLLMPIPGRESWAPDGNVCYSKLCTHAGCPVGLYLAELHELQCPCHFSAFDVLNGAEPVFGPAARPLPQLPLSVGPDGYLYAGGDFSAPVGPGVWNRGAGP